MRQNRLVDRRDRRGASLDEPVEDLLAVGDRVVQLVRRQSRPLCERLADAALGEEPERVIVLVPLGGA